MILLDTDLLTLLLAGQEKVRQRAARADERISTTVITRIEVLQGRFDSVMKAANAAELLQAMSRLEESDRKLERMSIIPVDDRAAKEFDKLRQVKNLKKIGRGDLLIASIALANNATLVTRNLRHFRQIPGLKLENWAD